MKLDISIVKIEVDEYYYIIYYKWKLNNKNEKKESYESDYEGWSMKEFKEKLEKGEALKIVLSNITDTFTWTENN
jgi:hypothetical protein